MLGVAGLVLPFLQGWLFLALGILILSVDLPFFARIVCWLENRLPSGKQLMRRLRARLGRHKKDLPDCSPKDM